MLRTTCSCLVTGSLVALMAAGPSRAASATDGIAPVKAEAAPAKRGKPPVVTPAADGVAADKPAVDKSAADKARPDRSLLRALARREAAAADVPFDLVDAVMKVESDYRPDRIGDVGEIGLMQVRPGTAAMLGFHGTAADLADPATNIHYGTSYLATAWHLAKGNVCRALMKYRAGHGNESMTPLSVTYCQRARVHLVNAASPLAATIQPVDLVATAGPSPGEASAMSARRPDFGGATLPGETLTSNGRPKTGAAFWAAFGARVRRINAGLEAKWRRTASR